MKRFLLLVLSSISCVLLSARDHTLDSLFSVYDHELERAAYYTDRHQARIDSLKDLTQTLSKGEREYYELLLRLAREYQHFQSDSSRIYYISLRNAPEPIRSEAFIGFLQLMTYSGHYANAFEILASPNRPSIRTIDGYKAIWLLYQEAATTALMPQFGQEKWEQIAHQYYDSLYEEQSRLWYE